MMAILGSAAWETFWYFFVGTPLTAMAWALVMCLVAPVFVVRGFDRWAAFVRRSGLFIAILFLFGAPGNAFFTLVMRDRYYYAADPIVDWLPWLPDPDFALDLPCGGHFLNGATWWTVLGAWIVVALPVWIATIKTFRVIQAKPDLRV
jgi:hypothetical protein